MKKVEDLEAPPIPQGIRFLCFPCDFILPSDFYFPRVPFFRLPVEKQEKEKKLKEPEPQAKITKKGSGSGSWGEKTGAHGSFWAQAQALWLRLSIPAWNNIIMFLFNRSNVHRGIQLAKDYRKNPRRWAWVITWALRVSFCEKVLPQTWQPKGRSPVCVRTWRSTFLARGDRYTRLAPPAEQYPQKYTDVDRSFPAAEIGRPRQTPDPLRHGSTVWTKKKNIINIPSPTTYNESG